MLVGLLITLAPKLFLEITLKTEMRVIKLCLIIFIMHTLVKEEGNRVKTLTDSQ